MNMEYYDKKTTLEIICVELCCVSYKTSKNKNFNKTKLPLAQLNIKNIENRQHLYGQFIINPFPPIAVLQIVSTPCVM